MSVLHRAAALLLAALLLFALSACGEPDANAGVYLCTEVTVGDEAVKPEKLFNGEVRLELQNYGRGRLTLGENAGVLRWTLEGEALTFTFNDLSCAGTLRDGVISFVLPDEDVTLTLVREDLAASLPTPTPQPEALLKLCGDWYGWWQLANVEGTMPETWYDCAASAVRTEDGLLLTLWDTQTSRDTPMGALALNGDGEAVTVSGGWFWYGAAEEQGIALSFEDGTLTLSGTHDAQGERFDYRIVLRPWGADWEDAAEKPYGYRHWYLPLIEAGGSLPDTIQLD